MQELGFRFINDSFNIPGLQCVENIMVFNNGLGIITVDGIRSVKVGYGIRIRFVDEKGANKTVTAYGNVVFFGITSENVTASTGKDVSVSVCGNIICVRAKIAICTEN